MKSSTITFTCDLCGRSKSIKGDGAPKGWVTPLLSKDKVVEICNRCIDTIKLHISLEDAKKMVEDKTPRYEPKHPWDCGCIKCSPYD